MEKTITDQYHGDPTYAQLHVLTRSRPLARQIISAASFQEKTAEVDSLPSSAFAWEDERRFPVHTREDTVASILYRSKVAYAVPEHVDEKLGHAADIYKLNEHMFEAEKVKVASIAKVAYALPEEERLPLGDMGQVKVAEHVLCRDFQKLRLEKRADAFSRLVEAAKEHDVELRPMALKMAGLTMSNTKTMRTWLEARAAASDGSVQQAFDKLASGLRKAPAYIQDRKTLVKLASTIEQLDTQAGLRKHYDRKLPDPLMTVFNTEKVATEMCDVAGTQVPCEELMALPPEIWEQVDAPEVAEVAQTGDTAMFKQVFDTLPLDIKVVLQSQLG